MGTANSTGNGFKFDTSARLTIYSDEDLLAGLRIFAATVNHRPFSAKQFSAWPDRPFSIATVFHRFGSWRSALARIGIHSVRGWRYEPEELIENLEKVWRSLGRPPGNILLERRGRFSSGPYCRIWGSLRRACQALERFHHDEISREDLLRGQAADPAATRRAIRADLSVHVRWRIIKRDRHRCVACGKSPATDPAVELHIDHILPVSRGGSNDEHNLRTLCAACNLGRGNEP